jgi:dienelactone hydrolase
LCAIRAGLTLGVLLPLLGCAVPQPRGEGQQLYLTEPTTKRHYFLYLPKDYAALSEADRARRRWPLVVTFHGMKPYDTAPMQALEWQHEADRYNYIVIAPELLAFVFLFGEFPLHTINRAFKSDELASLAIMDHVLQNTHADPSNVLTTGFSSGGYMAHYMLNRHPDRFTCCAVRQGDFSANILDSTLTAHSLYHPVLVLSTQFDFPICKEESISSIRWYESHGYRNFAWVNIKSRTHERTPDTAADFFAHVAGVMPNTPPDALFGRQALDGNPTGLALLAGRLNQLERPPRTGLTDEPAQFALARPATQRRPVLMATTMSPAAAPPAAPPVIAAPPDPQFEEPRPADPTPRRGGSQKTAKLPVPITIRVSATIGFEPLLLVYSADCPADWQRTASFTWFLDSKVIGQDLNGQRTITQPGEYALDLRVVTRDGTEHRASRRIRVLKNLEPGGSS